MGLIAELKRRNVLRMAAFYLAAAWLAMQVAEVLIGLGKLPDELGLWVLIVLLIGFPIALVVSWFFDVTLDGVVRESEVPEGQPTLATSGRRTDFVIIAMLAAAVILLLVWEPPASADDALTVLPFQSMTGPEEAAFSEGVSIELLNLLAQLRKFKIKQPPEASVLAHFSDIPTLANEMNVRWVLKGSVRRAENRVRIAVQLIDADDDAAIVWSNVFDRGLSAANLFAVQSEIARSITSELRQSVDQPAEERLAAPPTQNTEAYNAYLLGRQRLTDRRVDWLEDAVNQFAHAVELDRDFAGAYSGLADACGLYYGYSGGHKHEHCPGGADGYLELARKAVELDENLGEAWVTLGAALEIDAGNLPDRSPKSEIVAKLKEAQAAYERGLSLNPSNIQGYLWYAESLAKPQSYDSWDSWKEAWKADTWQSVIKRGLDVDPLSITLHDRLTDYSMWARTKEEAIYHAHRIIEIAPDSPRGYAKLSQLNWTLSGRLDESIRWASKAGDIDPLHPTYAKEIAYAYATLGDVDMAMAYWERAGQLFAEDTSQEKYNILRALILLSDKNGIPIQKVLEALEPIDVGSSNRMEIEANLALINGKAKEWLDSHTEYLSECLSIPIDLAYLNKWPKCRCWVDGLLKAAGKEARALKATKKRIEWMQKWLELREGAVDDPRHLMLLGEEEKALDDFEKFLTDFRSYPHTFRLYLEENLRFMLYHDPILAPIREHPRFQAVVAEVEADLAQQLENVREMENKGEIPTLEEVRAITQSHEQEPGKGRE